MKSGFSIPKTEMLRRIQSIKSLTGEVVFMDPIIVNFVPCVVDNQWDVTNWDPDNNNYIEIELNSTTVESPQRIRSKVNDVIIEYFAEKNQVLGSVIDLNKLHADILEINGVNSIRTVYSDGINFVRVDGLRFMRWSATILDGEDKDFLSGAVKLEDFMFPSLLEDTLRHRIKVITETAYQTNEVEY
jgi:hypothetical protein